MKRQTPDYLTGAAFACKNPSRLCGKKYARATVDRHNSCNYKHSMNKTYYRADESLGHMSITTYRVMHATFRRVLKEQNIDLTPEQWGILLLLWEKQAATQDELASASCVDKSSVSRVLALMEDKGLLNRRIDPDNERKKSISATEKSLEMQEPVYAITNQIMRDALQGISEEEAAICLKVLTAIRNNLRTTYL